MTPSTLDFHIRLARLDDGRGLTTLLRSLGWFSRLAQEPETTTQQLVGQHLEMCLTRPDHSVYVAVDPRGQIIGYTAVHWLPYLFLSGPEGFVSELFVAENARGHSVGKRLLAVVEEEARSRGCSRLQLINFRHRESYQRAFYPKAGWEERPDGASFVRVLNP